MATPERILFVFLDGVGIGPADADANPFLTARIPVLTALMGGIPTLEEPRVDGGLGQVVPLDATLGVEGLPQSGTGQAALLTGQNAAGIYGRHFGPWTPVSLRPLVRESSVLRRAVDAGRSVTFANAYPRGWPGPRGGRRIAGPPLAAEGAGLLHRHEEALGGGTAVASEIVNDGWRRHLGHTELPDVSPAMAGMNLARLSDEADLTFYAHYATDTAGHRSSMPAATEALELVDAFLEGVLEHIGGDTLLIIASDHGNLEDIRGGHTRGPVLCVASGPGADDASDLCDLTDVTPFLLRLLSVRPD